MKLIIELSEGDIWALSRDAKEGYDNPIDNVMLAVKNGTPLSEGHWIEHDDWDGDMYYECSICKEPYCLIDGTPTENLYNYCPNCGAHLPIIKSDRERNEDDADSD